MRRLDTILLATDIFPTNDRQIAGYLTYTGMARTEIDAVLFAGLPGNKGKSNIRFLRYVFLIQDIRPSLSSRHFSLSSTNIKCLALFTQALFGELLC